jgi:4-hydroxy-tetrahydrodipicolinate synthase
MGRRQSRGAHRAYGDRGRREALLIFPPTPFTLGRTPEMVIVHLRRVADTSDLPLSAVQYPLATNQNCPEEILLPLIEAVPTIHAIKDRAGRVQEHERHVSILHALPRPANVLSTQASWLLSSFVLGRRSEV